MKSVLVWSMYIYIPESLLAGMYIPYLILYVSFNLCTAPTSNPLLPAVVSLVVVVLLLITCVALLALALTVTATKLNKLRAEKAHADPLHCYNKAGRGEEKSTERIYDEVGEGTDPIGGQRGHYQELNLETMDKKQYETLHGEH